MKKLVFLFVFSIFSSLFAEDYTTANGNLFMSSANGDNLHVLNTTSGYQISLAYDNSLVLKEYDEQQRLKKENFWKIPESIIVKTIDYSYFEDTFLVNSKITTDDKTQTTETFNREQKTTKKQINTKTENEFVIQQEKTFLYDSENRLTKEVSTVYESPDSKTITEKTYEYTSVSDEPNTKIKKNGILESEIVYSAKNEYTQKVYLDDEISIVTEYKDSAKIKETYYSFDKIIRVTQ